MTTAEIQQLLDNAMAPGVDGKVTVPAGEHVLDAALRVKPGIALSGVPGQTVLRTQDPEVNFIELIPGNDPAAHDVEISDLHLIGPRTSSDITGQVASRADRGCGIMVFIK